MWQARLETGFSSVVEDAPDDNHHILLQAGDIVFLSANHLPKVNEAQATSKNFLHAQSFCDRMMPCTVVKDTEEFDFRACLFRVVLPLNYKAALNAEKQARRDSFSASQRKMSFGKQNIEQDLEERRQKEEVLMAV